MYQAVRPADGTEGSGAVRWGGVVHQGGIGSATRQYGAVESGAAGVARHNGGGRLPWQRDRSQTGKISYIYAIFITFAPRREGARGRRRERQRCGTGVFCCRAVAPSGRGKSGAAPTPPPARSASGERKRRASVFFLCGTPPPCAAIETSEKSSPSRRRNLHCPCFFPATHSCPKRAMPPPPAYASGGKGVRASSRRTATGERRMWKGKCEWLSFSLRHGG